jgi:uroporphyrinogen III methyltransferase/synthase
VTAPLQELPAAVRAAGLRPPSLIIVGTCVLMRETIAWFEQRPLFGRRIGITRPESQAEGAMQQALQLGAQPVLMPTIQVLPPEDWSAVDAMLDRLDEFDWLIFTSVNGVSGLMQRLWETGRDVRSLGRAKIATIGPGTADALASYRLRADLMPDEFRAEGLAAALASQVAGRRVLWVRASRGRDVLPAQLAAAGAQLEQVVVYRNLDVAALPEEALALVEAGELEWIALSSPSIARSLHALLTPAARARLGHEVRLASISPVTTAAAQEVGLPIAAEAEVYTWGGLFAAIVRAERS